MRNKTTLNLFFVAFTIAGFSLYSNCSSSVGSAKKVAVEASTERALTLPDLSQTAHWAIDNNCPSASVQERPIDFLNSDLMDYGKLWYDAQNEKCAPTAAEKFQRKLSATLKHDRHQTNGMPDALPFQGWLEGVHVEMIAVTALELGAHGLLNNYIDGLVQSTLNQYKFQKDQGCGVNFGNTCFDDYAQAFAAFAWGSVYEKLGDREQASRLFAEEANNVFTEMLSLDQFMCMKPGSTSLPKVCSSFTNASAEILSGQLRVVSFNHGFQNLGYGIGLLTSVSSGLLALKLVNQSPTLDDESKAIANGLIIEAQQHVDASGNEFDGTGCIRIDSNQIKFDSSCFDLGYRPKMFPVGPIVSSVFGSASGVDTSKYKFDSFDSALFDINSDFMSFGRLAVYGHLGFYWWNIEGQSITRPKLSANISDPKIGTLFHGTQIGSYKNGQRCSPGDVAFNVSPSRYGYAKLENPDLFTCWYSGVECSALTTANTSGYVHIRKTWVPNSPDCSGSIDFGCGPCASIISLGHGRVGRVDDNERCATGLVPYNVWNQPPYQPISPPYFSCWNTGNECTPAQTVSANGYVIQKRRCYTDPSTGAKTDYGCADCN